MPLKCVVIDDEPLAIDLLKNYISRTEGLTLCQTFEDAISGVEFLNQNAVDLLFLDINMPDISGIDLAKALVVKPMIIFTTAYKEFAFDGFELAAIDYLLKPIDFARFTKAVQKAKDYHQFTNEVNVEQPGLYVNSEYRLVKIEFKDIEYLESMEDYVHIHLLDGKSIQTLTTLKKIIEKLPQTQFKRIHRSYVVAINRVLWLQNRKLKLSNIELPVSESYNEEVKTWIGRIK
ncbi:MAG: response regulator transcription factor [Pedobacter sp.]|nr:MAG: response regulator transcription factor [Pedobacter sp.]